MGLSPLYALLTRGYEKRIQKMFPKKKMGGKYATLWGFTQGRLKFYFLEKVKQRVSRVLL
jgi:hypothetical protein